MNSTIAFRLAALVPTIVLLSGCQLVQDLAKYDVTETGGIAGHYAKTYVLPAATSEMEEYRSAEIYAILVDAAAQVVNKPADEQYLINKIVDTNTDLNTYYLSLKIDCKNPTDAQAQNIITTGCLEAYEANMRNVETDFVALAKIAVPTDKLQSVVSQLESGNYLGSITSLTTITGQLIKIFHRGAAIDRAGLQVVMQYDPKTAPSPDSFDLAYADFKKQGSVVGTYRVGASAINAMYYIAWDLCHQLAKGLSQSSITSLGSALDVSVATDPKCKLVSVQ